MISPTHHYSPHATDPWHVTGPCVPAPTARYKEREGGSGSRSNSPGEKCQKRQNLPLAHNMKSQYNSISISATLPRGRACCAL